MIKEALKTKKMSVYRCSKESNIPYTTLLELINNKTSFANCSVKTIYKLAKILDIPIEKLINSELEYRMPFEEFKSELCHILNNNDDISFVKYVLKNKLISEYKNKAWHEETLYTLAMLDYISKLNNIPLAKEYNGLRNKKLKNIIYPRDVNIITSLNNNSNVKENALKKAIPEFLKYNIVETDVRNVK